MNDNNTLNDTIVTIQLLSNQTIRFEVPRYRADEITQWFADEKTPAVLHVRFDYATIYFSKAAVIFIRVESSGA